ncbi:DUF4442 domain-containing protein [Motiliproteus coralliicola]|uniref:DUF4442 domain-containing protein n=1 Tax=Motiliproteus coralliicola TaxID=2283196 RepID=A0A369WCD6_9GAMM|nr:DUF4442 domain-containing protein [Motiliproteus coralliicola]RDE19688.1 DUF4442 domain-containing protein [Motiliproteus coralliicola]
MNLSPNRLRKLLNFYPPYLGAGVKVNYISEDWSELHVSMAMRWYNRNAVGTHFGGSLYSMIDPHLMLLLMQQLGRDYLVWDKAAEIEYIKAVKGRVSSVIRVTEQQLAQIKSHTDGGDKHYPEFWLEILDEHGELVAKVKKILYVKRKAAA